MVTYTIVRKNVKINKFIYLFKKKIINIKKNVKKKKFKYLFKKKIKNIKKKKIITKKKKNWYNFVKYSEY